MEVSEIMKLHAPPGQILISFQPWTNARIGPQGPWGRPSLD